MGMESRMGTAAACWIKDLVGNEGMQNKVELLHQFKLGGLGE